MHEAIIFLNGYRDNFTIFMANPARSPPNSFCSHVPFAILFSLTGSRSSGTSGSTLLSSSCCLASGADLKYNPTWQRRTHVTRHGTEHTVRRRNRSGPDTLPPLDIIFFRSLLSLVHSHVISRLSIVVVVDFRHAQLV